MKSSKIRRPSSFLAEILTIILFVLFLFPFFLVLINSAKTSFEVTQYPLAWPKKWETIVDNIIKIWTSESVCYPSSLLSPFQIVMFPLLSWFRTVTVATGIRLLRTYQGIILSYVGFGAPLSIFMFHGFIKSIPLELEEAATIDGCHRHQIFFRIIFPILKPIQATVLVLNGIWIWNDYLLPLLVLGKGNDVMTVPLAVSNFAGAFVKQWDLILTAILMAMIPVIVFFLFAQKYIVKGMVAGAIK